MPLKRISSEGHKSNTHVAEFKPAKSVPEGGAMCANCAKWNKEIQLCEGQYYIDWHGNGKIPTQPTKLYPNYFSFPNPQENTPVTTSGGQLITPGTVAINNTSIIFLPEIQDRGMYSTIKLRCYGICSNYVTFTKRMRGEGLWY